MSIGYFKLRSFPEVFDSFSTFVQQLVAQRFMQIGVLCLCELSTVSAQNVGKISGFVRDAETGEPLIGCNVAVLGTSFGASTDVEGAYFILNVPPGKYDLQASFVGYQKTIQSGAIVNSGKTTAANFMLTSSALAQQEVVVQATRPDVEREKTSTSAIIRSDEVQAIAGIRDVGDVLGLAADVTDGHFRGGREGEEYYTLQGMGINNPLDNSTAFLPIMSAVEEVEVITSGFGAQYGNAQSGVVNISMKEGKSDKWKTTIETRTRTQGRKHFGPSVFDPNANPYIAALVQDRLWLQGDPSSASITPYFTTYFSSGRYRNDTLTQLAVAKTLWQQQMHRDINRTYGNDFDYSVEAATGGPVDENLRMFVALRSNTQWPVFPTEQPDVQRQVMGNIASDLGDGATLRLSGGYTLDNTNIFPSSNGLGYYQWLWDRILAINYRKTTNLQLGLRFAHNVSARTFYEIKLNSLWTKRKQGGSPTPETIPDSLVGFSWDKILSQIATGPDKFTYLRGTDDFSDQFTRTLTLDANVTSQMTKSHLLNGGVQVNTYLIDVSNHGDIRSGSTILESYNVKPLEAALYVQDKMEFEGLIANVGVRFDLWNPNTNYYLNTFKPFVVSDTSGSFHNDMNAAPQAKTPMLGRIQPRIGVSFPVSEQTVFHLNYGTFMQRPSFQYLLRKQYLQKTQVLRTMGNPKLEPELTNSYDIGVTQGFGDGFTLDVSGYYKDVKDLIDQATVFDPNYGSYNTWYNRDYADIRGFRVALTKRRGLLSGSINYQYSVATGKSATTSDAPVTISQDSLGQIITKSGKNVPVRDITLNFDRTHNLVVNLALITDEESGPTVFGFQPFANMSLSTNSFFRSGRPYTSPSNPKFINGARTPAEFNTNLKLTKTLKNFLGTRTTIYVEIVNLFDQKILNYDYVFSLQSTSERPWILNNYEKYGVDDPVNGIRYFQDVQQRPTWAVVDQSFLIYDNAPRSFNIGFTIEL